MARGSSSTTHGRPSSWIAVAVILVGFTVGGVGLILYASTPWLLWAGVAIIVVGGIYGLATGIMKDVY